MAILVAAVPTPMPTHLLGLLSQRLCITKGPGGGLHVGLLGWARVNTVSQDAPPAADTREHLKPDSAQLLSRPVSQVSTG